LIQELPFVDTFTAPDMLHIKILRAEIPRGRIESINTEGVSKQVHIFGPEDIPGKNCVQVLNDAMPLLSKGNIEYEGEPVLLIASHAPDLLEKAERHIRISYETDFSLLAFHPSSPEQIVDSRTFIQGSPDRDFGPEAQIVEAEYHTAPETHINRAPLGAYTSFDEDRLIVHTPTHWPNHVRSTIAASTGREESSIRVIQTNPSPAYGEKVIFPSVLAAMAAVVTVRTGLPARLLLSPQEIERLTTRKPPVEISRSSVLDGGGEILAEKVHIRFDVGAFPFFTSELLSRSIIAAGSYYTIPHLKLSAEAVQTSSPPMNLYRGLGVSQSLFATEVHFSRLAEFSQSNPGEWKKQHAEKGRLVTGAALPSMPLPELLERVMIDSDFYRKHSSYELIRKRRNTGKASRRSFRGIGIAAGCTGNGFTEKPSGGAKWGIKAVLDKKDELTIYCGTMTIPRAIQNLWKRKAGEILAIPHESIRIAAGDTDNLPDSGPMMLAMPVAVYTSLVERCCSAIRKERFHTPLPIEVQRNITAPRKSTWDGEKMKGLPFHSLSWGAVVTEVELDPLSLEPEIRGIWAAFDCGLVYDTQYAVSIAEGSIYESLAWAMGEHKVTPRYSTDYGIEGREGLIMRLPPISVSFQNTGRGIPGGMNEIAESLVPSAFVTALSQAAGVYFDGVPLTAEIIQGYLEEPA